MSPEDLRRRDALLARNDEILDRWPQRSGPEFVREMTAVVEGLERLALEVDATTEDRLERSRNWRYVGNAYFDLADARDLTLLDLARDAYGRSEELLAGIDDAVERMKLDYSYGHALFHLSDAKDLSLLYDARRRYLAALEIARAHMPSGVGPATTSLANTDRAIALLTQAENLSVRISELQGQIETRGGGAEAASSEPPPSPAELFGQLLSTYREEVGAGQVSESRQQAFDPVLSRLGELIQESPADLTGTTVQRSRLTDLMGSMSHLLGKTSHGAPAAAAGGRAEEVWKRFSTLKLSLSRDLMRPHMGSEERAAGMEIFKRCGHADTYLHRTELDEKSVRAYETDVLRQLAGEVRAFSVRNHLTLISPIWYPSPLPPNPNAVFFSGGEALRATLTEVCAERGLEVAARGAPKELAASRWEQLWACQVALFDFTGHVLPDPDRPVDLAANGSVAAVSYELGIALALGRPVVVVAVEDQELPFDVDVEPVRVRGDGGDRARIADAVDDGLYGLHRGSEESSLAASRDYLEHRYSGEQSFVVEQSLRLIDAAVARDPVAFRRFAEPVLGSAGSDSPRIVFPAWPGSYPRPGARRCFHVTPFGPPWAGEVMRVVAEACRTAEPPVEYVRGDQVLDADIIRSIWDHLCQASHVVVDLTGLNPNVALELGIAHTLGRNVLLVTQDDQSKGFLPAIEKLRSHRYSLVDDRGLEPLRQALGRFLA